MDKLNGLIISEILADNPNSNGTDVDGDGNTNKADEFIELQNTSGKPLSLEGYEVWSQQNGKLFAFDDDAVVAPLSAATIVGNYSGDVPDGFYDAGLSEGGNFLQDGENSKFDAIFLVNSKTGEYIVFNYGDPPQDPAAPFGFPGTQQLGDGETFVSNSPNGVAIARNSDGEFEHATPTPGSSNVVCFTTGTLIATSRGDMLVQWLRPGDEVITCDRGLQPLRAVRRMAQGDGGPTILFPAGTVGNDRPIRVSPAHRMLVRQPLAELLAGSAEALVPARHFLGHAGIRHCALPHTYIHLLFDHHEILRANGAQTESLFMGDLARDKTLSPQSWRLQDGLKLSDFAHGRTVRPVLKSFEAQLVLSDMFGGAASAEPKNQTNRALA